MSEQSIIGNRTFIYLGGTVLCAAPLLRAPKVLRVDLDSIPHLQGSHMKPHEYEDLHLHPCINDDGEEADAEYVEELEKFKQPHPDVRPWKERSLQWERRGSCCIQGAIECICQQTCMYASFRRTFVFKTRQLCRREAELRRQPADQS